MKKYVLILCVILFVVSFVSAAHAQTAILVLLFGDKVASEDFFLSMRGGLSICDLSNVDDAKMRYGFNFGLIANIKLGNSLYLCPEFTPLSPKGVKNIPARTFGNPALDQLLTDPDRVTRKLNYIDVPVVLQYYPNRSFFIGAGPQVSFLTSAKDEYTATVFEDEDLVFSDDVKSELNIVEFGIVFEAGVHLNKKLGNKGLGVHARYCLGLTDIVKDNPGDPVKNSVFQAFVCLEFIKTADEKQSSP